MEKYQTIGIQFNEFLPTDGVTCTQSEKENITSNSEDLLNFLPWKGFKQRSDRKNLSETKGAGRGGKGLISRHSVAHCCILLVCLFRRGASLAPTTLFSKAGAYCLLGRLIFYMNVSAHRVIHQV